MERPVSRNVIDLPRPTARGTPRGLSPATLFSRLASSLPRSPAVPGTGPRISLHRHEPFLTPREFLLSVLVLGLLAIWSLEIAPLLHASHAVQNAATVTATLAAAGSGSAEAIGRRWLEDLPGTGPGLLLIRRPPGPNGMGGWVKVRASQDYYPTTPLISAFLPRVIHLEATEVRDVEP